MSDKFSSIGSLSNDDSIFNGKRLTLLEKIEQKTLMNNKTDIN